MAARFPVLYIAEADAADAVLSSGALAYLVDSLPQADFTVVGSPESAPLFADLPRLRKLIVLEREGNLEWLNLWTQLQSVRWGLAVDMRGSAFTGRLKRLKRAVRGEWRPGVHAVEQAAWVLKLDEVPLPQLFISPETAARAEAKLKPDGRPLLVVAPGAAWIGRRWPPERFATVAASLVGDAGPMEGGRVVVLGDEGDRDAGRLIRLALPRNQVMEFQGRLSPLEAAAVLARADLFIGGDSLWTQMAAAMGAPVVAAFGPSDHIERGPWGGTVVRGPRSADDYRRIDPQLNQAIQHMNDVPTERVLEAARKRLAERV